MRILIVEDEVRLAATLGDLMEMSGYTADIKTDSLMVDSSGMMQNKIGYATTDLNEVLTGWMDLD